MGFPEQGQANSVAFAFRVRFTAVALSVGAPHLGWDRRPSRRVRVSPLPADKAPVPGQQRARGH